MKPNNCGDNLKEYTYALGDGTPKDIAAFPGRGGSQGADTKIGIGPFNFCANNDILGEDMKDWLGKQKLGSVQLTTTGSSGNYKGATLNKKVDGNGLKEFKAHFYMKPFPGGK